MTPSTNDGGLISVSDLFFCRSAQLKVECVCVCACTCTGAPQPISEVSVEVMLLCASIPPVTVISTSACCIPGARAAGFVRLRQRMFIVIIIIITSI